MNGFYTRVGKECTASSTAVMEMADRFRELGDVAMAALADDVAGRLSKLALDVSTETQPIDSPEQD